jgi:type IV pilus assembly protein PilX
MKRPPSPGKQQGIVLIVAMVMLIVMSILGISSVRGIALEEKMASNAFDRSIAFQAAEAALRAGELAVLAGVAAGQYDAELKPSSPQLPGPGPWTAVTTQTIDLGPLVGNAPDYRIEYLGGNYLCDVQPEPDGNVRTCSGPSGSVDPMLCACMRFRVTARSNPGNERASVQLQSIFFSR